MAAEPTSTVLDEAIHPDNAEREADFLAGQITGMWELASGPPLTDEDSRHAIGVLGRLSGALRREDQVSRIEIGIGPRTWRFRQLPPLLLAMPEGGPMTAILGPAEDS